MQEDPGDSHDQVMVEGKVDVGNGDQSLHYCNHTIKQGKRAGNTCRSKAFFASEQAGDVTGSWYCRRHFLNHLGRNQLDSLRGSIPSMPPSGFVDGGTFNIQPQAPRIEEEANAAPPPPLKKQALPLKKSLHQACCGRPSKSRSLTASTSGSFIIPPAVALPSTEPMMEEEKMAVDTDFTELWNFIRCPTHIS